MYRRTTRKRKTYPSRYDRMQDAKIRKLMEHDQNKMHQILLQSMALSSSTGEILILNSVIQGETDSTREAAFIRLEKLSIRWTAQGSAVATTTTGAFRFMIVYDKDTDEVAPTMLQMLVTDHMLAPYNTGLVVGQERSRGRFKFLYDKIVDMPSDAIASADQLADSVSGKLFLNLRHLRTAYTADTGGATDVTKGGLFMVAISLDNSETITFRFQGQLSFHDLKG